MTDSTNIHTFKIEYDGKIPSVNQLYLTGRKGYKVWTYQNPVATQFKNYIQEQLEEQGIWDQLEQYQDKDIGINLNLSFVLHHNFWKRDVSNLIKATEDAIVNAGGLDDRYNLIVDSRKIYNDIDESEYIVIILQISDLDDFKYKWSQYGNN